MDSLLFSLSVAAIGILVVFVGLCILIVSIKVITSLATAGSHKQKAAPAPAKTADIPTPAPIAATVSEGIPADVIAAITAAIAAVWDKQGGFTVRHVRRVQNAPAWNRAGREDQIYSRF